MVRKLALLLLACAAWAQPPCELKPVEELYPSAPKWTYRTGSGFSVVADCAGEGVVTYAWEQSGSTPAVLSLTGETTATVSATGNTAFGTYTLQLSATDDNGTSDYEISIGSVPTDAAGRVLMSVVDPIHGAKIEKLSGPFYIADGSGQWPWYNNRHQFLADRHITLREGVYKGYHNYPQSGTITITGGSDEIVGTGTNFRDDLDGVCTSAGTVKGGVFVWWKYMGRTDERVHYGKSPAVGTYPNTYVLECVDDTHLRLVTPYPADSAINAKMEYLHCDAGCSGLEWGFGADGDQNAANGYAGVWLYSGKPANYYDNVEALRRLFYGNGLDVYGEAARSYCDAWWINPEMDRGQALELNYKWGGGPWPGRSLSLRGMYLCAIETDDDDMKAEFRKFVYPYLDFYLSTILVNKPLPPAIESSFGDATDPRDLFYRMAATADCVIAEEDAEAKAGCVATLAAAADAWIANQGPHGAFYTWWERSSSAATGHAITLTNGSTTAAMNGGDVCPKTATTNVNASRWFVTWPGDHTVRPDMGDEDPHYLTGTCNGTSTVTLSAPWPGETGNRGWAYSNANIPGSEEGFQVVGWGTDNFFEGIAGSAFEQCAAALDGIDNTTRDKCRALADDTAAFIRDYAHDPAQTGINTFYSPLCEEGNDLLCTNRNDGDTGANNFAAETIGGLVMNALRTGDATIRELALKFMDWNYCKPDTGCAGVESDSYQVEINDNGWDASGDPPIRSSPKVFGTYFGFPNNASAQALIAAPVQPAHIIISGAPVTSGSIH